MTFAPDIKCYRPSTTDATQLRMRFNFTSATETPMESYWIPVYVKPNAKSKKRSDVKLARSIMFKEEKAKDGRLQRRW